MSFCWPFVGWFGIEVGSAAWRTARHVAPTLVDDMEASLDDGEGEAAPVSSGRRSSVCRVSVTEACHPLAMVGNLLTSCL